MTGIADAVRDVMGTVEAIPTTDIAHIIRDQMRAVTMNLFDISNLLLVGKLMADATNYRPKVEDGELLSGGVAGATSGAIACVYVKPGDVIYFEIHTEGDDGTIQIVLGENISNGLFTSFTMLNEFKTTAGADHFKTYVIPEGYTLFGFAAFSGQKYGIRMSNIRITKEIGAAAEQAAAYSILMGDSV